MKAIQLMKNKRSPQLVLRYKLLTLALFLLCSTTALQAQTNLYTEGADMPTLANPPLPNFPIAATAGTYTVVGNLQTPNDGQDAWEVTVPAGFQITNVSKSGVGTYTFNTGAALPVGPGTYTNLNFTNFSTGAAYTVTYVLSTLSESASFTDVTNESMSSTRFKIQFTGAVTGLTASDFSVGGTAPGTSIAAVTGSGTAWYVHVNTGTGTGTINVSMNTSSGTTINNLPHVSSTINKSAMSAGTLSNGDLVFSSYFSDGGDRFSFVNAVDIPANETIYFTDHGWNGNSWGTSQFGDGIIEWSHTSLIPAGTQITITGLTASIGTALNKENAASGLNFSTAGDQIFAFQGQSNLIAGLHYNVYTSAPLTDDAGWDNSNSVTSSTASNLPPGLTTGTNAMRAGTEFDNGKLNCTGLPAADAAALRAYANDDANWSFDDDQLTIGSAFPACPTFLTNPCPPAGIVVNSTTPHCRDFTATPACWTNSGTNNWVVANGYGEAQFWDFNAPATWEYTTPLLLVDAGMNPLLKYDWSHLYSATYPYDSLDVYISTDTGTTWTNISHLSGPSFSTPGAANQAPTTGAWSNEEINLFAYAGQNIQLRYTASSDYGPDLFIDNICLEQAPSCWTPDSVTAYNITTTSAIATWRENTVPTPATQWQLVVHTAPASNPAVGLFAGTITTNQNVSYGNLLSPNTIYYTYVRSICGSGDTSAWSLPLIFTTATDSCGNDIYDPAGPTVNYANNVSDTTIYCPSNASDKVALTFTEFSFENSTTQGCFDGLTFYNGSGTSAPVIPSPGGLSDMWCWDRNDATPSGTGDLLGSTIVSTATNGCLTVVMKTDGSATRPGFTANVSCAPAVANYDVQDLPTGHIKADSLVIDGDGWYHYLNTTFNPTSRILLSAQLGNTDTRVDSVTNNIGAGTVDLSNAPYVSNTAWHVMNRTWNMAVNNQPTTSVPVRTYYRTSTYIALVAVPGNNITAHTDLHFYKINNGKDELLVNGHANVTAADYEEFTHGAGWTYSAYGGSGHRAQFNVTQFSGGGGGGNFNNNGALPVELFKFNAFRNGHLNSVNWTTASESNNSHFNVQRSSNGSVDFENLGMVYSKAINGNSNLALNYQFNDESPQIGHNYYRLEQVDIDGKKSYSEVVDVIWSADGSTVTVYPNPVQNTLNIDLMLEGVTKTEIRILDMSGRVIKSVLAQTIEGQNHLSIDLEGIATGIYAVQILENGHQKYMTKVRKTE